MLTEVFTFSTRIMEFLGVAVILIGALLSLFYLRQEQGFELIRKRLGRSILLGLEFMVAADIINTVVVRPTMNHVLTLGLIVLIRTFLSFSLEIELDGKLPWRK